MKVGHFISPLLNQSCIFLIFTLIKNLIFLIIMFIHSVVLQHLACTPSILIFLYRGSTCARSAKLVRILILGYRTNMRPSYDAGSTFSSIYLNYHDRFKVPRYWTRTIIPSVQLKVSFLRFLCTNGQKKWTD